MAIALQLARSALLVLLVMAAEMGEGYTARVRELRAATTNTSSEDSGGNEGKERGVSWLGRHWYVFVVFLVMVIVAFVLVCGYVLRRGRLSSNSLQIHQNGSNYYTPHVDSSHSPPLLAGRGTQHHTPAHDSIQTESSSTTRHTETSLMAPSLSTSPHRPGPSLTASARSNHPPSTVPPSDSPWSFIQIVAKEREWLGQAAERGRGGGGVRERGERGCVRGSRHKSHRHHRHCTHPHRNSSSPTYWQRRQHRSHHRHFNGPLAKVNGVPDDSGASLCSVPSTSGSLQSDQSSNRSDLSSFSHSENSTVIEVNVNVRLSPDRLDRAKAVAMAALAESARQLAESAANLGFSDKVQKCTRSLPHSPYPPPRHPRHSVTGAPLTPHSALPPPHSLNHSHLFHSRSSSHLPPVSPSLHLATDLASSHPPSPHSRLSGLERKSVHHYSPSSLAVTYAGGHTTEDEGTVISLDRHSSSSSCHHEQGQRSGLTQSPLGKMGDTVVNLDRYSGNGAPDSDADVTVVSLDRTERSIAGDFGHHQRSASHGLHKLSAADANNSLGNTEGCTDTPNNNSPESSGASSRSLHSRLASSQVTAYLHLDSQVEDFIPVLKQTPRLTPRDECHQLNGFSRHPHLSLQPYPHHLLGPNPATPKLSLHQHLHNISEHEGENEFINSSDDYEVRNMPLVQSFDSGRKAEVTSDSRERLAEPDHLLGVKKVDGLHVNQVGGSQEKVKAERKEKRRRRKERSVRHRDGEKEVTPDKSESGVEIAITKKEKGTGCEVVQTSSIIPFPVGDLSSSPSVNQWGSEKGSGSPLQQNSDQSSSLGSPLVDKAQSPPRSGSALSVSEPLSSTASGYAATGESGSTCDAEAKSVTSDGELGPEFEEIQRALLEARSQFSYPLLRLLDQDCLNTSTSPSGGDGSTPSFQSHTTQFRFQTHSAQLSRFGSSAQQIELVNI